MSSLKKEVQQYIECCDGLLDDAIVFTVEEQQFLLYYTEQITNAVRVKIFSASRNKSTGSLFPVVHQYLQVPATQYGISFELRQELQEVKNGSPRRLIRGRPCRLFPGLRDYQHLHCSNTEKP
jgi:hypothetical protein